MSLLISRIQHTISIIGGCISFFILVRFFFALLGANSGHSVVSFFYSVSQPFVAPFRGIFNRVDLGAGQVFEPESLISIFCVSMITWFLCYFVTLIFVDRTSVNEV